MKNKYVLYLLLCGMLLYFAVPRINVFAVGVEGLFAISWLMFALFVIAGNLIGLLFNMRRQSEIQKIRDKRKYPKQSRSY